MSTLKSLSAEYAGMLADMQARIDALNVGESASAPTVSGDCAFSGTMAVSGIAMADPAAVQPDAAPAGLRVLEPEHGFLGDCAAAGIPRDLLLPICPGVAGNPKTGKAPSYFYAPAAEWRPKREWQKGKIAKAELTEANQAGANVGLLLGVPSEQENLLALDVDTDAGPDAVRINRQIVNALRTAFGCADAAERESWDYRSLLLVSIPVTEEAGGVQDFNVHRPVDGQPIPDLVAKIQILGKGCQCVIGGTHHSGNTLTWTFGGKRYTAPPFKEPNAVIRAASRQEVIDGVKRAADILEGQGLSCGLALSKVNVGDVPELEALAAPSARDLVAIADAMQNPPSVDYESYKQVMMAFSGAFNGLRSLRSLPLEEVTTIELAIAGWMARWSPPPGHFAPTLEEALALWQNTWGRPRLDALAGWPHLVGRARKLIPFEMYQRYEADCKTKRAQNEFTAEDAPDPKPLRDSHI